MHNILIIFTKLSGNLSANHLDEHLKFLPKSIQSETNNYLKWDDKYSFLIGRLILLKGLEMMGFSNIDLTRLRFRQFGKPFFDGNVEFNLSHSGGYVLGAFGKNMSIGVDIEKITKIKFNEFRDAMNEKQWKEIMASSDSFNSFFKIWTMKESIMKADGRGFTINPKKVFLDKGVGTCYMKKWYLKELNIAEEVSAYLATDISNPFVMIRKAELHSGKIRIL